MIHKKVNFTNDGRVYMNTYFLDYYKQKYYKKGKWQPEKRPVFLILPGGGYGFQSDREAEPIAMAFNARGLHCAVLYYSVLEYSSMPNPLEDVSKAIWYLRKHAEEFHINPNAVIVGGFSAGGNLSSIIGTQWDTPGLAEKLNIPRRGNRPDALMLAYAPTELIYEPENTYGTDTSAYGNPEEPRGILLAEKSDALNTAKRVNRDTPPAFIWQTSQDQIISPHNALAYADACYRNHVECELHVFQYGLHGTALANDVTDYKAEKDINVETWVPMFMNWIRKQFHY